MKHKIMVIALIALLALCMMPAQAEDMTITMSNPGGQVQRDIVVYFPNGTMQGFYNSTSVITLNTTDSLGYTFSLKPVGANPMDDFSQWINDLMDWARTNATAIIIFVIMLAVAYKFVRR
jgi:hypothetical protein